MARHDKVLTFIGDVADKFGRFRVVGINENDRNRTLPITEIVTDDSDGEICLVGEPNADAGVLILADFYNNLQTQVQHCPEYTLVVSEWFEIDAEHTGRIDVPLKGIDVDEETQTVQLLY